MLQKTTLTNFLSEHYDVWFTNGQISTFTGIPKPRLRAYIQELRLLGIVEKNTYPNRVERPEYRSTELLMKNYVDSLKIQKRKLQIKIAQQIRRQK